MSHYASFGNSMLRRREENRDAEDERREILALTAVESESPEDDPEAWKELALCAETDPEVFFPEKGGSTREGKAICQGCEVRSECLNYALTWEERFGIWGGYSERERRRMKVRIV